MLASDVDRVAALTRLAHELGSFPPMLYARGMVCREFVDLVGDLAQGQHFVDLFVRDSRAPTEEQALLAALHDQDAKVIGTASHGFGWDGLRLLAAAFTAAGPNAADQVAYLEGLKAYHGATGDLTFTTTDHNGHGPHDPTTFSRLDGDAFQVVSTGNRALG